MCVLSQKSPMKTLKVSFIPLWCGVSLVYCFVLTFLTAWFGLLGLFWGGSLETQNLCPPCPAQRGGSLWNSFFVSEATATIKLFWVKWLSCPAPRRGGGCVLPADVPSAPLGGLGSFPDLCWFPVRGFSGQGGAWGHSTETGTTWSHLTPPPYRIMD